jgi:biopolymer transport protein ExbD
MDDLHASDRLAQQSAVTGLIPLIDVLLVVLTFLMWMSVSPGGTPKQPQPRARQVAADPSLPLQVVALSQTGRWFFNGTPTPFEAITDRLRADSGQPRAPRVLFLPSDGLEMETVSESFRTLRATAGDRVRLRMPSEDALP